MPYAGAVGDVSWLRLRHRIDLADGEHELRAGTSRDGHHWIWAATLTLPADSDVRIGLGSHGADSNHQFNASFDYLRLYRR